MKNDNTLQLICVHALEKGLIDLSGGWNEEKAAELFDVLAGRPKPVLPKAATSEKVYEMVQEILIQLEDADEEYVPEWAKELKAG